MLGCLPTFVGAALIKKGACAAALVAKFALLGRFATLLIPKVVRDGGFIYAVDTPDVPSTFPSLPAPPGCLFCSSSTSKIFSKFGSFGPLFSPLEDDRTFSGRIVSLVLLPPADG